jgi:Flp pilus assembly protein TadD
MSDRPESPVGNARTLMERGQRRSAIELLRPWVADFPDDARAWETLGAAHFELENWKDAETAAREVVRLRPDSARAWCNWGMLLRKLGRLDEAERVQYRALNLDPAYDRARTELQKLHRLRVRGRVEPEERGEFEEM